MTRSDMASGKTQHIRIDISVGKSMGRSVPIGGGADDGRGGGFDHGQLALTQESASISVGYTTPTRATVHDDP